MGNITWIEWLGYLSSVVITISLLMSSIIKLRWINLVGAALMACYGMMIHAVPVFVLNLLIALINIYYLVKIYSGMEKFKLLELEKSPDYLNYFLETYRDEIKKIFPNFSFQIENHMTGFYLLRNLEPAGIFIGKKENDGCFHIDLDFVTPEYRDFKLGNYIYTDNVSFFKKLGYKTFQSVTSNLSHLKYLKKMGFSEKERNGTQVTMTKEL